MSARMPLFLFLVFGLGALGGGLWWGLSFPEPVAAEPEPLPAALTQITELAPPGYAVTKTDFQPAPLKWSNKLTLIAYIHNTYCT